MKAYFRIVISIFIILRVSMYHVELSAEGVVSSLDYSARIHGEDWPVASGGDEMTCPLQSYVLTVAAPFSFCQGDPSLDFAANPMYMGVSPDLGLYGVKFYVVNTNTGIIELITSTEPDLTVFMEGEYEICTIQFLLTDESLLPTTGQSYANIQNDIDNGLYCAYIQCEVLNILADIPNIDMDWDNITDLCAGVVYNFNVDNYDPALIYSSQLISGGFFQYMFSNGILTLGANSGPINICASIQDPCGDVPDCKIFNVVPGVELPIIDAPAEVCLSDLFQVSILNNPLAPQYDWTISGPGIITTDNNSIIEVLNTGIGMMTICATASSPSCGTSNEVCVTVNVTNPPAPTILAAATYCVPGSFLVGNANGGSTGTLYTQVSGPGTITFFNPNVVSTQFNVDLPGTYTIMLTKFVNGCSVSTLATFEVLPGFQLPILDGPIEVCPNSTFLIEVLDNPLAAMYDWVVSGAGVLSQNLGSSIFVATTGTGPIQICAAPQSPECGMGMESCFTTTVIPASLQAPQLNEFDLICIENSFSVFVTNPSANSTYEWNITGQGIVQTILSNTEYVIMPTGLGVISICVNETSSSCGSGPATCFDVDVVDPPDPVIIADPVACFFGEAISGIINDPNNSVEWNVISGPGNLQFGNAFTLNTNYVADTPGTYQISLTENNLGCVRTSIFDIEVLDDISVDAAVTCTGNSFTIVITFLGGMPPYSVFGSPVVGNVYTSPPYPSGSAVLTTYANGMGCEGQIFNQTFCSCTSDAGTMIQDPIEICGSQLSASGMHNADATLELDDIGVYILHDAAGSNLGTIYDENTTGVFSFLSSMTLGQTYYISYVVANDLGGIVDLSDPCLSVSVGQPVVWNPQPIVEITQLTDNNVCDYSFEFAAETTPATTVGISAWSIVSTPAGATLIFSQPDQMTTTVEVDAAGMYVIEYTGAEGGCIFVDQLIFEVSELLELVSEDVQCAADGSTYTVELVIDGTLPITINGELYNGGTYISQPYSNGDTYSFNISDNQGCAIDLMDEVLCNCTSDAGTMSNVNLTLCEADLAVAMHNSDALLDGNDTFIYMLHDNANNVLGNILDSNTTGTFGYSPMLNYGQTYYISYVVATDLGGIVDLSDPCLSVSVGQPVVWSQYPIVTLPMDIRTCEYQVDILAESNANTGLLWEFVSQPVGSSPMIINGSTLNGSFIFDIAGIYEVAFSVGELGCSSTEFIQVEILPSPQIVDVTESCLNDTYTVSFDLNTGLNPYTVNGSSIIGSSFVSTPIASGTAYSYIVEDANTCTSVVQGVVSCDCVTDAGTMSNELLEVCGIEETFIINHNGDEILDNDDIAKYILHDGNSSSLGTIFRVQDNNVFSYGAGLLKDVIYYVSLVVGNDDGSSMIDLTDGCISVAQGTPIMWRSVPVSSYPDSTVMCEDAWLIDNLQVHSAITEISWMLIDGTSGVVITENQGSTLFEFESAGIYSFEYMFTDGFCTATDTATIEYQEIVVGNVVESCDLYSSTYTVNFTIPLGTSPFFVNGVEIIGDTYTSAPIASGDNYSFSIEDSGLCLPVVIDGSKNCECPNAAGSLDDFPIILCSGDTYVADYVGLPIDASGYNNVFVLHDGTDLVLGNIYAVFPSSQIVYNSSIPLDVNLLLSPVSALYNGIDINVNDPCLSIGEGTPVLWYSIVSVDVTIPSESICQGDSFAIEVIIQSATYPVAFFVEHLGETTSYISSSPDLISIPYIATSSVAYEIMLIDQPCIDPDASLSFEIAVVSCDCIEHTFEPVTSICSEEEFINLDDWKIDNTEGLWAITESTMTSQPFIDDSVLFFDTADTGFITLSWISSNAESCDSTYIFDLFVESYQEVVLVDQLLQFCPDSQTLLDMNAYLSIPASGFWVSLTDTNGALQSSGTLDIGLLQEGSYSFQFVLSGPPLVCAQRELIIEVFITDSLEYIITSNDPDCYDENGILAVEILNGNTQLSSIFIDDELLSFPYTSELEPGFYDIEITDENFCTYLENVEILQADQLSVQLDTMTLTGTEDQGILVSATSSSNIENLNINWYENGELLANEIMQNILINLSTDTQLSVLVTDENGCTAEDLIFLTIVDNEEVTEISVPNIFSPSSVVGNDVFFIPPNPRISTVKIFSIYDRWGNLIFSAKDFDPKVNNIGWDGMFNNSPSSQGVYAYVIHYEDVVSSDQIIVGDITLLR